MRTARLNERIAFAAPTLIASTVGALVVLAPRTGAAINGQRPRVQPDFENVQCLARVDRTQDPVFHVEYSIEMEDTVLDPIDVPSGRRHQFLALGVQRLESLPFWITWDDVAEAGAAGLIIEDAVTDRDVFDTSELWPDSTWARITPDSPRIPITFDAAAAGVDWDTTGVAPGPWQVLGYTWDPERNERRIRDGIIMVTDGDDPTATPPGAHVRVEETLVREGDTIELSACVDAEPGATLTLSLGAFVPESEPQWIDLDASFAGEGVGASGRGDLVVRFELPYDLGGNPATDYRVRLRVEDGSGRRYDSHASRRLEILDDGDPAEAGETGDGPGGGPGSCACATGRGAGGRSASGLGLALMVLGASRRLKRRRLT